MPLWKNGTFVEDDWTIVADDAPVADGGRVIVGLKRWRDERQALAGRNAPLGLLLAPGSVWTDIVADLPRFPVIAVTIPKYADGRAFSIARLLRERDGYAGEIRALGDYIIDQVPFMMRVGIDAFETSDPILIAAFERGEWPEVPHYLQPAFDHGTEVPAGARPWVRKRGPGKPAG
jgi:phosphoadenosine phosphosulfate reductase